MRSLTCENVEIDRLAEQYAREGYVLAPPVIAREKVAAAERGMEEVMAGRYETGVKPLDNWWSETDDANRKLRKIDQPHLANSAIRELITDPVLGEWVAAITGAKRVQVWAVQLLNKPGGADATATVGWHQDYLYWRGWWTPESEVFTTWIAISDVRGDCGPMCFVPGSHEWGLIEAGNFFESADENRPAPDKLPAGATWGEVPAILPPGAFSLHHRYTFHGSYANRSAAPRRSFAVHMRTENSCPLPRNPITEEAAKIHDYIGNLDNEAIAPVIYRA